MIICLIPARANSKRIKNKNIKLFNKKPIIAWPIKAAFKSKVFDEILVSTDSLKIKRISEKYGAKVPFLRPKKYSNDYATDKDVINHFIMYCKKIKLKISYLCYVYPTAVLIDPKILKKTFNILKKKNFKNLVPITKYSPPIQSCYTKNSNNEIFIKNKKFKNIRTQRMSDHFYDTGQFYWHNFDKKSLKKTYGYEISRDKSVDIDTNEDLKFAEQLFKLKKK